MPRFQGVVLSLILGATAAGCAVSGTSPSAVSSGSPSPSSEPSTGIATIALTEWKVSVPDTLKAGTWNFTIRNAGTIAHELLVFKSDLDPSAYPKDSAGNIVEDGPGIDLLSDGDNIDPNGSQTRAVDLSTPSKYLFVCNIPGHFHAGMFTVVTVTP